MDASQFANRPHPAAGDNTRSRCSRAKHDTGSLKHADNLMIKSQTLERHEDKVFLGVLNRLTDGIGDLACLSGSDSHMAVTIPHHNKDGKAKTATALDHLSHAVEMDHFFFQIKLGCVNASHNLPYP